MATERQLVQFEAKDFDTIREVAITIQQDSVIKPFLDLSTAIRAAIGMLPEKLKPKLYELYDLHSSINMNIKDTLSSGCATATKFVVKGWIVMKRGMNKENEEFLNNLRSEFICDYVEKLQKFTEKGRTDLNVIHKTLMLEASDDQREGSLKEFSELERQFLENAKEKTDRALEKSKNQGQIELLKNEIQICERAIQNSVARKNQMTKELDRLKEVKPEYEKEVREHYDPSRRIKIKHKTRLLEVREIYSDNGERIAKENLTRLTERIEDLETTLNNWSAKEFEKRLDVAKANLTDVERKQEELAHRCSLSETEYRRSKEECERVSKNIKIVHQQTGTQYPESIKMVDSLANDIQNASVSLIRINATIKQHLQQTDNRPKSLVLSMIDALKLIAMADECFGTNNIDDICRQVVLC
ncbi:unnamed protein product [Adineta steineri]|uniref:Uncharacterized protein n=1 Tax=Adineta steineri TaxID=433720 RepID=A0A819XU91_9BILA|nr:unnamed protein product [Adineta steineri]CAF4140537.1 unnamed protein product [Adineta steineri]